MPCGSGSRRTRLDRPGGSSNTGPVTEATSANPVSVTAYWTLAARHADATGPRPVGNDTNAERFMDDDARAVAERFSALKRPFQSFPVRHRVIDDMLREELGRDRGARIVVIGCGFDTRAYRLDGGRWVEVDEPELLAIKEARLPAAEAPNPLERVPIRFREDSLEATLMCHATDERVVIVLEGILGYVPDSDRRALLATLVRLFPHHAVVCDLVSRPVCAPPGPVPARDRRRVLGVDRSPGGAVPRARPPHGCPYLDPRARGRDRRARRAAARARPASARLPGRVLRLEARTREVDAAPVRYTC